MEKLRKKEVPIPSTVYSYNRFMSGVDRSDQLIMNYNVLRQTKKYWKTLFLHFIDIAVVNSYILYKEVHPSKSRLSHYDFRETLVRELCHLEILPTQSAVARTPTLDHVSERMEISRDCVYCKVIYGVRRRTTRHCPKCQAPLCFLARNCFQKFRQKEFREGRNRWLQHLCMPVQTFTPKGRPKGSLAHKGRGRRRRKNW